MISEKNKRIAIFILKQFNDCVGCYGMASHEDIQELKIIMLLLGIQSIYFDGGDFATINF